MPVPEVVVVEGPRRFPHRIEAELARRHRELLDRAHGRVLDLSDVASRLMVADAVAVSAAPAWDTVVSVAELIRFPDLGLALRGIDRLLVSDGRMLVIEPVMRPGTLRMFAAWPWMGARAVRGFHVGRDLTAAIRTTTFTVDDIERFTVSTAIAPLRNFVAVDTRRPRAETDAGDDAHDRVTDAVPGTDRTTMEDAR